MINTDDNIALRQKYGLPDEFGNLALRALIVDEESKVIATACLAGNACFFEQGQCEAGGWRPDGRLIFYQPRSNP